MKLQTIATAAALLVAGSFVHAAGTASFTASGFAEDFDSMGAAGTAPPTGWSMWTGPTGTSNATWTSTIPASGVAALVATSGALTASSNPTATNNNGYNAAFSTSLTTDRLLAASPTTVSGAAIELRLSNDSGASLSDLLVSYDTRRFTAASTANELPGYWLFYSLDGSSWTNVSGLNPTLATVPNTVGVTSVTGAPITLSAPVAAGQTFWLRWLDDNAQQTSPDQIIGLNNVSVSAVPEPGAFALLLAGVGVLGFIVRRRQAD